jgi:hypothetical protein
MQITELSSVTISIAPRDIERLLDALAQLPHPINPDLRYEEWLTHVDFPAWNSWVDDLRQLLEKEGFHGARLRCRPAIDAHSLPSLEACGTETCRTKQLSR